MHNLSNRIKTIFLSDKSENWLEGEIISLLERKKGEVVKSSNYTTVLSFNGPYKDEVFYFKEYHNRGIKDIIKNIFGFTRGKRELKGINLLISKGFNAPKPIIYGYVKYFGVIYRNFLITKGLKGERTYQYFKKNYNLPLNDSSLSEKRALISRAGTEIGLLHAKGIFHGDLRVGNILIIGKGINSSFYFIDNERTRTYKKIPMRKRIKNLVQLNMVLLPHITRTDRLRFFLKYLENNIGLQEKKKELIKNIQSITENRLKAKYSGR